MIVVRNVFHLKFGKAQEAVMLWKEGMALFQKMGQNRNSLRLLTDFAGARFYTLVFEMTYDSISDYEKESAKSLTENAWKSWYQKFVPLAESGYREILKVVE